MSEEQFGSKPTGFSNNYLQKITLEPGESCKGSFCINEKNQTMIKQNVHWVVGAGSKGKGAYWKCIDGICCKNYDLNTRYILPFLRYHLDAEDNIENPQRSVEIVVANMSVTSYSNLLDVIKKRKEFSNDNYYIIGNYDLIIVSVGKGKGKWNFSIIGSTMKRTPGFLKPEHFKFAWEKYKKNVMKKVCDMDKTEQDYIDHLRSMGKLQSPQSPLDNNYKKQEINPEMEVAIDEVF